MAPPAPPLRPGPVLTLPVVGGSLGPPEWSAAGRGQGEGTAPVVARLWCGLQAAMPPAPRCCHWEEGRSSVGGGAGSPASAEHLRDAWCRPTVGGAYSS